MTEIPPPGAEQLLRLALQQHQSGRLTEAEALYRQILDLHPHHADALHLSGLVAHQRGQSDIAVMQIGKAIAVNPMHPVYYSNLGLAFKAQGKPDKAIDSYLKSLSIKADIAEVHFNLGAAYHDLGRTDEAMSSYRRALALKPGYAEAHRNLGNLHYELGNLDEAATCLRALLALRPNSFETHNNLGILLSKQGKLDEAIASYQQALAIKPDHAEAQNNLGLTFREQGRLDDAIASFRDALGIKPDYVDAQYNLGKALQSQGKLDEAADYYGKVLLLRPGMAEAHFLLGNIFNEQAKPKHAIASYRQAIAINPDYAEARHNLGTLLKDEGELDDAIDNLRKAYALRPDFVETHANLGGALLEQGRLDEAIASFRKALALRPNFAAAYSNLLFLHAYHATLDPAAYLAEARGWELACVSAQDRLAARSRKFQRSPLAGRRLRVGYVSGDFLHHAVTYFIEQLFAQHDRDTIELSAYSTSSVRDAVTDRLQAMVDHWVPVAGWSDASIRDRIDADGIDVLIDLSGHTARSRIGVFAHRAAPVQLHYVGFFASTGLTEMDYYLGDDLLTPPETDHHFSEQTWRLPRVSVSYKTVSDVPEPDWRPAGDGTVWLGSFNDIGKLNPRTLALWAKVLHALPEGRLLLKTKGLADAGNRRRMLDALGKLGISAERIELQPNSEWADYIMQYNRLDIALDPVGGHGGYTTTCDALWMGVPVIHALGDRATSRMTASMLNAIGHPEWITHSDQEYIDKVVALARDVEQRKALRPLQRERMANSPLCDAEDLARHLEKAYREMFERWQANASQP